jgi:hypothetical protein
MTRHLAAAATACALAIAVPAAAQTTKHPTARRAAAPAAPQTVQLTGCLSTPGQANEFSLAVTSNDTSSLAAAEPSGANAVGTAGTTSAAGPNITEGSQVQLIGDAPTLTQLADRKVQIKGTIVPQKVSHSRNAAPATRVRVDRIERLAESCQPGATAGTSGTTPAPSSPSSRSTEPTAKPMPSSTATPTETPAATPTPAPSSASRESGASAEAMISGLNSAEVQQILGNVGPQNISNASDVFDAAQVDALTQALEKDAAALKKAQELTTALQGRGLLTPNERVVGISGTTIYKASQK